MILYIFPLIYLEIRICLDIALLSKKRLSYRGQFAISSEKTNTYTNPRDKIKILLTI